MKKIGYGILTIWMCVAAASCHKEAHKPDARVTEAARRDVERVAAAPEGSVEREYALLSMRVREHNLRLNGFRVEADDYVAAAQSLLTDSLHIVGQPRHER